MTDKTILLEDGREVNELELLALIYNETKRLLERV